MCNVQKSALNKVNQFFLYMCKSVFYVTRQTQSATITDKSSFSVKQTRQKYHCVKIKSFFVLLNNRHYTTC